MLLWSVIASRRFKKTVFKRHNACNVVNEWIYDFLRMYCMIKIYY